jgi:hypothetical protein
VIGGREIGSGLWGWVCVVEDGDRDVNGKKRE